MAKHVELKSEWCKGCNICVSFCPREVLKLENGKVTIANPDSCVRCGLCESFCPDFAIYLVEEGGAE